MKAGYVEYDRFNHLALRVLATGLLINPQCMREAEGYSQLCVWIDGPHATRN